MKYPHNHTTQSSCPHSKVTAGSTPISCPLTHPWWIYRANQMKISHNHGAEVPLPINPFPDESPGDSEDWG